MQPINLTDKKCQKLFWWFAILHGILWTIIPTWLRYALPHDTIEGAMWGQHLAWGYDKNPWMNAWFTRLGWIVGGTSGIGIYALSSLGVGLSFWSVWRLGLKILTPVYALVAVFLLEGCVDYTLVPQSFNDNLIELALWPLMFLSFYYALEKQNLRHWFAVGVIAGLAMMAKYYTMVPLCVMFAFLLTQPEGQVSFKKCGIYLGFIAFISVILPHLIWLTQHHYLTIIYALDRAKEDKFSWWAAHFYYPINFAFAQAIDFVLPLFLFLLLCTRKRIEKPISHFNQQFLWYMALGPYILTIFLSMLLGWRLYNEWGVPLIALWGLLLVAQTRPLFSVAQFRRFVIVIYIVMFLWAVGYALGLWIDKKHKHSDNYPAQTIANVVTQIWWDTYHKPLKYVAGSRYIGGYIAFYSKDHPSVFVEWNPAFSPWIDIDQMKKYGALFIQDNYYGTTVNGKHPYTNNGKQFPPEILKEYPNLKLLPILYFSWHRGNKALPPVSVLVGILPPENQ